MNCQEAREWLTAVRPRESDEAAAAAAARHRASCAACRAFARDVEPTLALLRDALAAAPAAPDRLSPAVRARLLRESVRSRPRSLRTWVTMRHPGLAAAAAVLLVAALAWVGLLSPWFAGDRHTSDSVPAGAGAGEAPPRESRAQSAGESAGAPEAAAPLAAAEPSPVNVRDIGARREGDADTVFANGEAPADGTRAGCDRGALGRSRQGAGGGRGRIAGVDARRGEISGPPLGTSGC